MNRPELLAPAGDLEKLKMAITYGADAVFLGGEAFGLRASSKNFTIEQIKEKLLELDFVQNELKEWNKKVQVMN